MFDDTMGSIWVFCSTAPSAVGIAGDMALQLQSAYLSEYFVFCSHVILYFEFPCPFLVILVLPEKPFIFPTKSSSRLAMLTEQQPWRYDTTLIPSILSLLFNFSLFVYYSVHGHHCLVLDHVAELPSDPLSLLLWMFPFLVFCCCRDNICFFCIWGFACFAVWLVLIWLMSSAVNKRISVST